MSDAAALAIVLSVLIVACTAEKAIERGMASVDPVAICVRNSLTHADRMQCMACKP